jgi:tRNA dimethylallyltransferase
MENSIQEKLDTWLLKENGKPKIVVVYGPTACGKSSFAVEIGKYLKWWGYSPFVISVDARQIYKWLNIWTGKIQESEMWNIPHCMLDTIDPSEATTVVDFKNQVEKLELWKDFQENKSIPILCGWTWLYIDSFIFKRSYPEIEPDWKMRNELEEFRAKNGNIALWEKLNEIDSEYAKELHPNNYHYVMRGIEVMQLTGKSKLSHIDVPALNYDTFFMTPYDGNREKLYERINARVEDMFLNWLIEEVWYNINIFTSSAPGLKTIGYKEVADYLEWKITLEECKNLVKQHNRNYAKRQITWNKKYDTQK